jgi:hypothetical protein
MKKNVIFITNIKDPLNPTRSNPYKYGIESWKNWSKLNNFKTFILEEGVHDSTFMRPTWNKVLVFDILEKHKIDFDQVLIVDSDTLVHPDCPNFFNLTDNCFTGVANEGSLDWVIRSIENYSKFMFNGFTFPFYSYLNSGFLIVNKSHKLLYEQIFSFYIQNRENIIKIQDNFYSGTDQPVINFFLHLNNIDVKILPYFYNMQDLNRKEILDENLTFTKLGWVYHYNAIPNNKNSEKTFYWMKKTYEHLYGELK